MLFYSILTLFKSSPLEKNKTVKPHRPDKLHVCPNCHNKFYGKICNHCGEKVFHDSQLSAKHFIHQTIDVFTHFENKVVKTIWLLLSKPGFVTKENLRGVRVPYAKPVQVFVIVNLFFYMMIQYLHITDYTPSSQDGASSYISDKPGLGWMRPVDKTIMLSLKNLRSKKLAAYEKRTAADTTAEAKKEWSDVPGHFVHYYNDQLFINTYNQKVSFYSKTLIFILIPVFAAIFYLVFYKKLQYYGSALILSTHFVSFNLLFYSLLSGIIMLPYKWFHSRTFYNLPGKAMKLLYNDKLRDFSNATFGIYEGFEALHVIFFGAWLFFAFRRLFNLHWLPNLIASYLLGRIFFILIFCLYKKLVIAFTLWSM